MATVNDGPITPGGISRKVGCCCVVDDVEYEGYTEGPITGGGAWDDCVLKRYTWTVTFRCQKEDGALTPPDEPNARCPVSTCKKWHDLLADFGNGGATIYLPPGTDEQGRGVACTYKPGCCPAGAGDHPGPITGVDPTKLKCCTPKILSFTYVDCPEPPPVPGHPITPGGPSGPITPGGYRGPTITGGGGPWTPTTYPNK